MKTSTIVIGSLAGIAVGLLVASRRGRGAARALAPRPELDDEEVHLPSATAIAADALRTGVNPYAGLTREAEIPHEEEALRMGDPDVHGLGPAHVGDEIAGGDMSTPDQDRVDDIGRAWGINEADAGALQTSVEILSRRDRRR